MSHQVVIQGTYEVEDDEYERGGSVPLTAEAFTNLLNTTIGSLMDLTIEEVE